MGWYVPSLVIPCPQLDLVRPVDLLQHHRQCQSRRQLHRTEPQLHRLRVPVAGNLFPARQQHRHQGHAPEPGWGTNPLFFFAANCLVLDVLIFAPSPVEGLGLYLWLYYNTTAELVSTEFGATLFCVLWTLIWLPLAEMLYRRGIIIKLFRFPQKNYYVNLHSSVFSPV